MGTRQTNLLQLQTQVVTPFHAKFKRKQQVQKTKGPNGSIACQHERIGGHHGQKIAKPESLLKPKAMVLRPSGLSSCQH
jgi:hypothetical protein